MTELTLSVPFDLVDAADQCLLEVGDARWMVTQDLPTASAKLVGVFSDPNEAQRAWRNLQPILRDIGVSGEPSARELQDQDWRDSYKLHFQPSQFGSLHWVPIWRKSDYVLGPGEHAIWLDPGLAFGTGNHETTRLCCERLVAWAQRAPLAARVIDAGCGSGILALSASRLGFTNVEAFDNDPEAIRVSEENAALNQLSGAVKFSVGDLESGLSGRSADLLLANIQADVLMRFASALVGAVAHQGTLVLSGILAAERDLVVSVFQKQIPRGKIDSRVLNEWSDVQWVNAD